MKRINKLKPDPLALSFRNETVENIYFGWICVLEKDKIIFKAGDITNFTYLRSVAKPIQAIQVIENKIKIIPEELAIICGSHTGSHQHLSLLKNLIKKFKINLSDIKCGLHMPTDEKERNRLIKNNLKSTVLHNNCSGKHIGMLTVCKKNKWDIKTYLNHRHLFQKQVLKKIKELSDCKYIPVGIDGCGVPTYALPVINIAKLFSNFTYPVNHIYVPVIEAISNNAIYAGGQNQTDTEIIKASKGRLISKVGGAGLIVVAFNGRSAVVKVADGSPVIRSKIIVDLLLKLKWLSNKEIKDTILEEIHIGNIKNHAGRVVGKISTNF